METSETQLTLTGFFSFQCLLSVQGRGCLLRTAASSILSDTPQALGQDNTRRENSEIYANVNAKKKGNNSLNKSPFFFFFFFFNASWVSSRPQEQKTGSFHRTSTSPKEQKDPEWKLFIYFMCTFGHKAPENKRMWTKRWAAYQHLRAQIQYMFDIYLHKWLCLYFGKMSVPKQTSVEHVH